MAGAETPSTVFNPAGWVIGPVAQNGGFGVRDDLTAKPADSDGPVRTRRTRPKGRRRPRVEREAQDLAAMISRMMRALARRAEGGDLEALAALVELEPWLRAQAKRAARGLVEEQGYSWGQLALRLGITRQSAHGRWGGDQP